MPYIIREVFTAKPGQAGKMAKMFKKMAAAYPDMKGARVMTDMVGPYNTVVMEMEVGSIAEWEKYMNDMRSGKPDPNMTPELMEEMSKYHEMFLTGRREIWRIE